MTESHRTNAASGPVPAGPGFYFGRPRFKHPGDCAIEPRAVRLAGDGSTGDLYVQEQYSNHDVFFYDWFGPVPAFTPEPD